MSWINTQHRHEIGSGEPTKIGQDPKNLVLMRIGVGTIKQIEEQQLQTAKAVYKCNKSRLVNGKHLNNITTLSHDFKKNTKTAEILQQLI